MVQGWLSLQQIHILFSNVSSVILHSLSRNCFTIRIKFFTSISKSVVTCTTITVTNISNSIIKQYYGIMKLFKVLVIIKKKQFSRTNILIQGRSITLNKHALSDFKNILMMSICQDGKFIKGWDVIAIRRWPRIALSFDGLTFLKVKGDPNMSYRPNFQVPIHLTVIERIVPSTRIFINHSRH